MTNQEKTTISFISLGCFKNLVDTEVLGGLLEKKNLEMVSPYEDSDWVIINTCGFIQEAKEESIDEILATLERKEKGEIKHVAIFGCLPQRYHQELVKNFQSADIIWGVNDFEQLAEAIEKISDKSLHPDSKKISYQNKKPFLYDHQYKRIITTTPNVTFIKISEGCNMKCSFCAIPQIRGPYRSRTINSIIEEAKKYKSMDFQEINLISQNSSYFGKDRNGKSELPLLLKEISHIGFQSVRVLYLMPEEVNDEIINAFAYPSIVPYFDLPFQHVSEKILKDMNRGGNWKKNTQLLQKIRKKFKDAVIRSSFIVGFPGETEEDFQQLISFAKESEIERIGVFGYSDEENTEAFNLKEKLSPNPPETIELRKELLLDVSDENLKNFNEKMVNTYQEFLPLGPWDNNTTIGRIKAQAPDTDGLTCVNTPFLDQYKMFWINITHYQDELIYGETI